MSEQKLDVYAEIVPDGSGWRWVVTGDDVPISFKTERLRWHDDPTGWSFTRWGARRSARRTIRQIHRFHRRNPEVIR